MPDSYFDEINDQHPQIDIEWHDRFLDQLVLERNAKVKQGIYNDHNNLDLTEFVEKLNFNKRWTYSGSLTTAPCDEGILWNVIENVIPIRQSTMDSFTKMRRVQTQQITNPKKQADKKIVKFMEELKKDIPKSKRSQIVDGDEFFRVAGCNRKVQDQNDRPVYRIDL